MLQTVEGVLGKDVERAISAPVGGKNKTLETGSDCYKDTTDHYRKEKWWPEGFGVEHK